MCGLAVNNVCQIIPWVQFSYDLRTPNDTLGNVNIGYGLAYIFSAAHFPIFHV